MLNKITSWWYRDKETDIYDSHDFDELWGKEEQETNPSSRLLEHSIKKTSTISYSPNFRENINVIEHPTLTAQSEVMVVEPRAFDEVIDIVEELRCRKSVVLNLQYLDSEQSQRVVDFLSGATHALDGHQQRVGQGVFIFVPSNFVLNTESQEARALKDAFWSRNKDKKESSDTQYQFTDTPKRSSIF